MRRLLRSPGRAPVAVTALVLATAVPLCAELAGGRSGGGLMDTPVVAVTAAGAGFLTGAWLRPPLAALGAVAGAGALTAANQLAHPGDYSVPNDLFFYVLLLGGTALAGALLTARREQVRELRRLSGVRAGQRDAEIRTAGLEERSRIDTGVAHALMQRLSGLVVQSSGARRETRPEASRAALGRIERTARDALEELRSVLGALREPDPEEEAPPTAGQPVAGQPGRVDRRTALPVDWTDVLAGSSGVPLAFESVASAAAQGPPWANVLAGLAVGAPLVLRRRRPLAAAAAMFGLAASMSAVLTPAPLTVSSLAPLSLAAYAIGDHTRGRRRLAGLGVLVLGLAVVVLVSPPGGRNPDGILPTAAWLGLTMLAGVVAAQHTARARDLRALVRDIEGGRHHAVRLAVAEQRQAMARDLHDSVAHAMTVVCLHAEAAQQHWRDAETVAAALGTIEDTVRGAIRELRHGLEELRPRGDTGLPQQSPGSSRDLTTVDVERLLAALADGIVVTHAVTVSGEGRWCPETVAVATRVAREALVNVARHAPGSRARVRVAGGPTWLVLEVTNRVGGATTDPPSAGEEGERGRGPTPGTGTGLRGLAELVAANGGRLEYGAVAGPRFRVAAYLPTTERVPA